MVPGWSTLLVLHTTPSNFNKFEWATPLNKHPETAPTENSFLYPLPAPPSGGGEATTGSTHSFPVWDGFVNFHWKVAAGGHIAIEFFFLLSIINKISSLILPSDSVTHQESV